MIRIYILLTTAMTLMATQGAGRKRDERGAGVLELVVIGLGLMTLAIAAVAVFTGAVNTRLGQIH